MQRQRENFDQDRPAFAGKATSIMLWYVHPVCLQKHPLLLPAPMVHVTQWCKRKTHLPMKNSSQPQP